MKSFLIKLDSFAERKRVEGGVGFVLQDTHVLILVE